MRNALDRRHAPGPPDRGFPGARWPARAVLVVALSAAAAGTPASAGAAAFPREARAIAVTGDRGPIVIGNGRHNYSYAQVHSPTYMRGVQHVSNASVIGHSPAQVAICRKRHRICHISEKLWIGRRR
ncbi:hypothetical protein ABZT47_37505 [Sphaerisporangium sp. NPDC005289]|uniref:hypothetical protein n=1 Tax=Sphaerisporangium sp. NPDC005289 TaxID=3155247 RepID=UPI0033AE1193